MIMSIPRKTSSVLVTLASSAVEDEPSLSTRISNRLRSLAIRPMTVCNGCVLLAVSIEPRDIGPWSEAEPTLWTIRSIVSPDPSKERARARAVSANSWRVALSSGGAS